MTQLTRLLPVLFTALIITLQLGIALSQNDGHFTYSLDDPYIHLDLAEQWARTGVYGVNDGEVSSPSSSILWPLLITPFYSSAIHLYVPLILNILSALGSAYLIGSLIRFLVRDRAKNDLIAVLACTGCLTLNLSGMALMGMEHSLQVFLTLLATLGTLQTLEGSKPKWWLWAALFFAPLIRYESIITTTGLLGILVWLGYWRSALATGLAALGVMGAFSAFLMQMGLDAFPSSTLVKKLRWGEHFWTFWLRALAPVIINPAGFYLVLAGLIFPFIALFKIKNWRSPRWAVLASIAAVCFLNIFLGRFSIPSAMRYEYFALAFALPLLLWLMKEQLLQNTALRRLCYLMLFFLTLPGLWSSLYDSPRSMRSIYLQQEQMANLVKLYWQDKVAINDIGLIGYKNPYGILDLIGLANADARRASWSGDPDWADKMIRQRNIKLIMVFRGWFPSETRRNWVPVGELFCTSCNGVVNEPRVLFLTPYPEAADSIRAKLRPWAATLPEGAYYTEYDDAHPAPADN